MAGIDDSGNVVYDLGLSCQMGCRRSNNEDNYYLNGVYKPLEQVNVPMVLNGISRGVTIVAVCDGMGGTSFGEYAAWLAVATIDELAYKIRSSVTPAKCVNEVVARANERICREANKRKSRMGSTLILAVFEGGFVSVFNLGDSRAYHLSQRTLRQLSHDHTVAQDMRDMGLPESQATQNGNHQLTQHLGIPEQDLIIQPYQASAQLKHGDRILLCSDGLWGAVSDDLITKILSNGSPSGIQAYQLTRLAEQAGGSDNITAVVVSV